MALTKRGEWSYGDSQADIREAIAQYSAEEYPAEHYAGAGCSCGGGVFRLSLDDNEGAAVRTCSAGKATHPIGDSADYLDEAELEECECPCGSSEFEITAGVALYADSEDVKWLYLGCRCPACGITAVYGDWKNEFEDYRKLLAII